MASYGGLTDHSILLGRAWLTDLPLLFQSDAFLSTHQNAAQRVLDGMNFVIQSVSEYGSGPTKAVTAWLTDQVAPPYWRPNVDITVSMRRYKALGVSVAS